jgi:hypothetical protein
MPVLQTTIGQISNANSIEFQGLSQAQFLQIKCELQKHVDAQSGITSEFYIVKQEGYVASATKKDTETAQKPEPTQLENFDLTQNKDDLLLFRRNVTPDTQLYSKLGNTQRYEIAMTNTMLRLLDMTRSLDYLLKNGNDNPEAKALLVDVERFILNFPTSSQGIDPIDYKKYLATLENHALTGLAQVVHKIPELSNDLRSVSDYQTVLEQLRIMAAALDPSTITQTVNTRTAKDGTNNDVTIIRTETDVPITEKTEEQKAALDTLFEASSSNESAEVGIMRQTLISKESQSPFLSAQKSALSYMLKMFAPLLKDDNRCLGDQARKIMPVGTKNGKVNIVHIQAGTEEDVSCQLRFGSPVPLSKGLSEAERLKHTTDNLTQLLLYLDKIGSNHKLNLNQLLSDTGLLDINDEATIIEITKAAVDAVNGFKRPKFFSSPFKWIYNYFNEDTTKNKIFYSNIPLNGWGSLLSYRYDNNALKKPFGLFTRITNWFKSFLKSNRFKLATQIHENLADNVVDGTNCASARDRTGGKVLLDNIMHELKFLQSIGINESFKTIAINHAQGASTTGGQNNPGTPGIKVESNSGALPKDAERSIHRITAKTNKKPDNIKGDINYLTNDQNISSKTTDFNHSKVARELKLSGSLESVKEKVNTIPTVADTLLVYELLRGNDFFTNRKFTVFEHESEVLGALQARALTLMWADAKSQLQESLKVDEPTDKQILVYLRENFLSDSEVGRMFKHDKSGMLSRGVNKAWHGVKSDVHKDAHNENVEGFKARMNP